MCLVVGNGRNVRLRLDDWIGVGSSCNLFPRVFMMMFNKEPTFCECFKVGDGCTL